MSATLIAEFVAFFVVLFVLYRFVWPLIVKMVRDRQDTVQQQVEAAEEATRKLDEATKKLETAIADANADAARIRDDARADATQISQELKAAAEQEMVRLRQRGEEQLAAQRDQAVRQLRVELGGQSLQLAERIVTDTLADDAKRGATVDGFLDQLDALPARGELAAEGTR